MRAYVIHAKHDGRIEDLPTPCPAEGQALVRVLACGLCGSDLHAFEGTQPFFQYPQVPGHEMVGEVVELCPRPGGPIHLPNRPVDENLAVGDRVVLDPAMPCGVCHPCGRGRYNCCVNMRVVGVHAQGALAEFVAVPAECLHRVPDHVEDELATLAEPLSIGVQATNRARVAEGDRVLVLGAGAVGLCVALVAMSQGARVAVTDLSSVRRATALELGCEAAFDPAMVDLPEALAALWADQGPTVVVEAVGTQTTAAQALELVQAGGRVVLLGLIRGEMAISGSILVRKELDFLGSRLHGGTLPKAVQLLAQGRLPVSRLLSRKIELEQVTETLQTMATDPDAMIKAVVRMC